MQRGPLLGPERGPRQLEQRRRAEEIVQQLHRCEHRPHALERLDHVRLAPQPAAQVIDRQAFRAVRALPLLVQPLEQESLDQTPAGVVRARPAAGGRHDLGRLAPADAQDPATERHLETAAQGPLAITHGFGDDRGHALVTLEAGDLDRFGAGRRHLGHERCGRGQVDARLTQRRQHLLDVTEEEAVGPEHEHALALEQEAVGVEEVGGPVERDRGLARARAALHDEHAGQRRPDDLVLLGLDGGDDVAHEARARPLERGQQRRRTRQATVARRALLVAFGAGRALLVAFGAGRARGGAEQLVLQVDDPAPVGDEVAAAPQAHGMAAGGPVEGLRRRHPPVDDQRRVVDVGHRQAPDVVRLAVVPVDAPEADGLVADPQALDALERVGHHDVALDERLRRAHAALAQRGAQRLLGRGAGGGETLVRQGHVGLLGREVGVGSHRST